MTESSEGMEFKSRNVKWFHDCNWKRTCIHIWIEDQS